MGGSVIRRRVIVDGRVQGVWFRESCRQQAAREGVVGWVMNRPDGRVEAVFEGPADRVEAMVAWSRSGPPRAVVTGVRIEVEEPEALTSFRVR